MAVNVTPAPKVDGFSDEPTDVVVEMVLATVRLGKLPVMPHWFCVEFEVLMFTSA